MLPSKFTRGVIGSEEEAGTVVLRGFVEVVAWSGLVRPAGSYWWGWRRTWLQVVVNAEYPGG